MHDDPPTVPRPTEIPNRSSSLPSRSAARPSAAAAIGLLIAAAIGLACERTEETDRPASREDGEPQTLATVDGTPISARTNDAPLLLDLHDLDRARYVLRRDRLLLLISERLGPGVPPDSPEWRRRVELELPPPRPPRLTIPDGSAPTLGPQNAPITIVEFLDFESAHSRRLQPDLQRVLERYPDRVRLLARDLPLPYHRYARAAAAAAHCAGEQDRYWRYHDVLLLEQPNLSAPDLAEYATRVGLDLDRFETCTGSGRHDARIAADQDLAAKLGVRRAATVFVNGLYLTGRPGFEEIDRVVREELVRLGLDPSPPARAVEGASGDATRESGAARPGADADKETRASNLPKIPPEALAEPEAIVTLMRAEVTRALEDRRGLDRKLEASTAEFSGERLLKIRRVDATDFYARLGLEERDVLLVVNGAFVTAEGDSIWDAFESGDTVTLLVMRRGLPHTYEYRIR